MKRATSTQPILFFFIFAGLFLLLGWSWWGPPFSFSKPAPLTPEQAREAKDLRKFKAQSKKDELVLLTENSFFAPSLRPLAGEPVFLAAGVEQWEGALDDEQGESGDRVEFEVVQGRGQLVFFTDLRPGQAPPMTQTRLQTPALGGYEAFVWLLTEPGNQGEVVVRAKLVSQGERAPFVDEKSQLLFHIRPIIPRADLSIPSVKVLAENSSRNDEAPHAEVLEKDHLNYPGGQGVFTSELKGIWFGPTQARVFQAEASGAVREAAADAEKRQWAESRELWHSVPSDLQGLLTHLDEAGQNWGFLSYSEAGIAEPDLDRFRPAQWILEHYRALLPEAGPEDQITLTSFQEDPEKPVEVQIHRVHRSGPIPGSKGSVWGRTLTWSSELANIHHIYSTISEERKFFLKGTVPIHQLVDELQRVVRETGPGSRPYRRIFWKEGGCDLRDIEPSLEGKFRQFGHPPGILIDSVKGSGPAARNGLQADDVVVMIDWQRVPSAAEAEKVLAAPEPEEGWPLLYWRKGVYQMKWVRIP